MKRCMGSIVVCLALLLVGPAAFAATYYVATTGNDTTGNGSSGNPWATLQKAVNTMVAGDTTIVKNGTYAGFRATESKSGTSGSPYTIKAENTGQVTLNAKSTGAKRNAIIELEGNWDVMTPIVYWDVEGFVVDGVSKTLMTLDTRWEAHNTYRNITARQSSSRGLYISHGDYCLMENCTSYSNNEHGSYQANSCTNNTYRNNTVYSNASCGFHNNGDLSGGDPGLAQYSLYENNTSYSNPGASINCDGLELCMFRNNLAYNDGKGIALFQVDAAIASRNNNVYNNTLVMGASSGYPVKIIGDTVAPVGNKLLNNILYHRSTANNRGSISIATNGFTNFVSDYNVVMDSPNQFEIDDGGSYESLATWRNRGLDLHSIVATESALFVNGSGNDYHLSATSPARDAGTSLTSDVVADKDGVSRPRDNGYDIGCYEYPGSVNPLTITTTSLPGANTGVAYSQTLAATGGQAPYTWSLNSGSLPAGLSLASGGVISGTPTGTGTSNFTVRVTDSQSSPATATKALSIAVTVLPVQITTPFLRNGWNGIHYSQKPQITGGLSPFTWSILSGTLPTGLSLNTSTGEVSGTPTANNTYNFTLRVADSQPSPSTAQLASSVVIGASSGTYYWVSTTGSDTTGTGAWDSPWATLQHAADTVPGNSTILVEPGTYVGVQISWSGSPSSPDTFMSDTVRAAIVNQTAPGNNHNSVFEIENYPSTVSYWTVDGFTLDGANRTYNYGIDIRGSDHMTVRNLEVRNCGATGLYMSFPTYALVENNISHNNGEHGSYQANQGSYNTYRKNVCYSNSGCGFHNNGDVSMGGTGKVDNALYEKNITHDNNGAAYNMDGVELSTFKNNMSYNDHNKGMALFQGDAAIDSRNDNLYNNTIVAPSDAYYCIVIQPGTDNPVGNKLKNNVLYHYSTANNRGSICMATTGFTNFESDYNVVMSYFGIDDNATVDTLAQWQALGYDTHSIQAADTALFVNPGSNDWHLKTGSPAINAGTTLAAVTDDMDGNTRPQGAGYDIGCYEYLSGGGLSITTASLPADTISVAYNQTLAATGGTTPYTWSLQAGGLPAGLSLVASTGAITGTPSATGTSLFTARVTDSLSATATKALSIVINAAVSITTASLPADTVGVAYNQTLTATGGTGTLTWSLQAGSLPAGLSLVASTGAITGTPTASGTSNFTAKATDTVGASATKALSIVINAAVTVTTASLPADTISIAYNQTLAATGGTGSLTWSISSGSLPAGLSLVAATGAITGTPTASGTSNFTATATDTVGATGTKALSITINAAVTITTASLPADTINTAYPSTTLGATGGTGALAWSLQSGSLPAGLSLVAGTGAITGTPTATGTSNFTAKATDTLGASATKALSVVINAAPSITTSSLPADTVGVAYNQTLAATGGTAPLTWSLQSGSLPAGLSLVSGTGAITGTPTTAGTSSFTAKVTDNVGASATQALAIVINAGVSITTASLPADTINIAYNQTLAATGGTGALTWSLQAGSLPAGLSLVASTGAITGTPTAAGTSSFTAKATDTVGASGTKALSIVINAAPSITTSSLPADTVGIAYNQTLASTGGTAPLTWSLQTGTLPAGLSLVAGTGAITGTPTTAGTSNFTTLLTDNVGATATKALSIVINAAPSITTSSLPNGSVGVAYNQTMAATGGTTPLAWSISSGSLPSGLSLVVSTGAITGTPTASGTSNFTARVTDNVSATATKALSIVVVSGLTITTTSLPVTTVGATYNQTLVATGGVTPYTWAILSGSLPAGLSLVTSTGAITGTATASGTSSFTARVTDNVSATATQALSIVVNAAVTITTASLPADTVGIAYNQTLSATGGTGALTWSIPSGSLPAGLSLVTSTGAITGTPTASGTSSFTAMATDAVGATGTKALSIVVNAAVSITTSSLPADTINIAYNQTLAATGGTGALTWSLQSGSLPAGLSLTAGTGAITGTPTATGTSSFTAKATDALGATGTKALSIVVNAAPSITTSSLPATTVGATYNQTLAATGGTTPFAWSLASGSLPAGLSLTASTGAITGTPTASGTSSFTARVTDNVGATATKALSIVVNAAITITTASLPSDTINVAYNQTLAATGGTGALTWSVQSGTLPAGLSLVVATGAITGTPTASGTSSFTAKATDTVGATGTKALSIVINAAVSITTSSLPAGTVGTAYSQTLASSGGTSPYTWSIQSGSLPAGLSLVASTGAITGTPTATGTSSFTAKVTDNVAATATQALSIIINASGPHTYYVSTTGNDTTGDGSSGSPWATIQKGVDTMAAGDTVIVTNGSYAGFRARYSGSSGAVKTVRAQNALGAVITSAGAQCTTPSYIEVKNDTPANGVSYWVVDGFETTGSANYAIEIQYGDHVTVQNCKAHNSTKAGFSMSFSNYCTLQSNEAYSANASGLYVGNSGDNCSIVSNSSHNNASNGMLLTSDTAGGDMTDSNWLIEKNTFYANSNAMTCDGLLSSTMRNNLCYGSSAKTLRLIGSESAATSANNRILNNTFLQNTGSYYDIVIHKALAGLPEGVGNKIFNNILYNYDTGTTTGSICVDTAAETSFESDYNVVMNYFGIDDNATILTLAQWRALGYDTHSIQAADTALFVTPGSDFHLKAGSPAINAGTTLADCTDDKDGVSRPQGGAYDIGCYELVQTEPTYQFAASDGEATTTSTTYVNKATLTFTPGVSDSWVILGFAETKGSSTSYSTNVRLTVDGGVAQDTTLRPKNATDYQSFVGMKVVSLSAAAHTLNIDYSSANASGTAYIRNARIVAIRQASLVMNSADQGDTASNLTTTMTDYITTSFTPATAGDYLLVWSTALNGNTTTYATNIEARLNGVAQDTASVRNNNAGNWVTFVSFQVATNLPASAQTISLAAAKASASGAVHQVKRSRVAAIRLTGGRYASYQTNSADGESTTTSTTFQNKLTKSWTPGAAGNWAVLTSFRMTNSSTSYSTEAQVTVDDSTTSAQPLKRIQATTDYLPMGSVDVRNLTAASHHMDVNYRSANASGTAKIKYVRFVGLPL